MARTGDHDEMATTRYRYSAEHNNGTRTIIGAGYHSLDDASAPAREYRAFVRRNPAKLNWAGISISAVVVESIHLRTDGHWEARHEFRLEVAS